MIGIISAIGAAFSWTYACFIWRNQTTHNEPLQINFFKNLLAFLVFTPFIVNQNFYSFENKYFLIILLSGIIGIGIGDTFYLKSLQIIGTRKTLSIEALSPIIAALIGQIFINENLKIRAWIGICIVSISLILIVKKQTLLLDKQSIFKQSSIKLKDYVYAFLSVFCAVMAALLSRLVLLESNLTPIQTTEVRLLGSIIFLFVITKMKLSFSVTNLERNEKINFLISVILGTNIGIYLQQVVFKELPLGIGWTLLSTSPLISLIFTKKEEGIITKDIIFTTLSLFLGLALVIL